MPATTVRRTRHLPQRVLLQCAATWDGQLNYTTKTNTELSITIKNQCVYRQGCKVYTKYSKCLFIYPFYRAILPPTTHSFRGVDIQQRCPTLVKVNTSFQCPRWRSSSLSTTMTEWMVCVLWLSCPGFPVTVAFNLGWAQNKNAFIVRTWENNLEQPCRPVTQTPTHITVPGHSHYSGTWGSRWKVPVKPSDPHRGRILWQKQSVTWCAVLRATLRKPLVRGDFVSVTLLGCDLLSPSRSLTDETLSVMPLSQWSYTRRHVSRWLMDSKGHDGWDIKLCTVQRI